MSWHWPQYVYLVLMIVGVLANVLDWVVLKEYTGWKLLRLLALSALSTTGIVWVLHCGGFW
jgi:hypothetical protein